MVSGSALAHLAKLGITVVCIRNVAVWNDDNVWPLRGLYILLVHSILGLLRFGTSFSVSAAPIAKCFRIFYDWFNRVADVVPFALFTTGFLNGYGLSEKVRLAILSLGMLPVFFQLNTRKESQIRRHRLLTSITATVQLLMITLVGLRNGNYNVISLAASYIFERFFIDEFCYYYDIPSTDLTQYCLCFIEVFMVVCLNEL